VTLCEASLGRLGSGRRSGAQEELPE